MRKSYFVDRSSTCQGVLDFSLRVLGAWGWIRENRISRGPIF